MSLSVAGVWAVDVWDQTVWADGVWREGEPVITPALFRTGRNRGANSHNRPGVQSHSRAGVR